MSDSNQKKPDYVVIGLIALLVSVFVGGQWLVLSTLDARIATLESTVLAAVERGPNSKPEKEKEKPAASGATATAPTPPVSAAVSASASASAAPSASAAASAKKP